MSDFNQQLQEYAENELKLIGFMDVRLGKIWLDFLSELANISKNDKTTMKKICDMMPKLIDQEPLTSITEADFELETIENGKKIERCTRYRYLYKIDNKYYDDRCIAFKTNSNETDIMYIYGGGYSSKQEVQLPYLPAKEIRNLPE